MSSRGLAGMLPRQLRELATLALSAVVAGVFGVLLMSSPGATIGLVLLAGTAVVLITVPLPMLLPVMLLGMTLVPTIVIARQSGSYFAGIPFAGQTTLVVLIAAVCVGRAVLEGHRFVFPPLIVGAIGAFVAEILVTVLVAYHYANSYSGMIGEMYRQLALVLAFFVGLICGQAATTQEARLALFRGIARVGVGASTLAIVYWLWVTHRLPMTPPGLGFIFSLTERSTQFASDRSVFPFVQDSPNLASVVLLAIGSVASVPLLLSERTHDRRLAISLVVLVVLAMLTTQSRTGLLAMVLAPLPFLVLMPGGVRRRKMIVGVIAMAMMAYGGYKLYPQGRQISAKTQNLVQRQHVWKQAYSAFSRRPVLGQGYHYSVENHFVEVTPEAAAGKPLFRDTSVHNEYLGRLVDGGILGEFVFVTMLGAFLWLGGRLARIPVRRAEGISVLGLMVSLMVSMVVNAALESAVIMIVTLSFIGFASSGLQPPPMEGEVVEPAAEAA